MVIIVSDFHLYTYYYTYIYPYTKCHEWTMIRNDMDFMKVFFFFKPSQKHDQSLATINLKKRDTEKKKKKC